jgi:DNA-binding NtrC family response regulator
MERALVLCVHDVITTEHMPVENISDLLPAPPAHTASIGPDHRSQSAPPPAATSGPRPRGSNRPTLAPLAFEDSLEVTARRPAVELADLRDRSAAELKVDEIDRRILLGALEQCAGNQNQAAKMLGISRRTLVIRLETYKLPRPRKPVK